MITHINRPPKALVVGSSLLAISFASPFIGMLMSGHFHMFQLIFFVFGWLPIGFAIYRLLKADRVARALVTLLCVCAIGSSVYLAALSIYHADDVRYTRSVISGMASTEAAAGMQESARRTAISTSLFGLLLALGLGAVYLPQSNRWFRQGHETPTTLR